jgi:3-oxoacyl-[acyl-carrier-protein] synthase-1
MNARREQVYVTALGACCPIGRDALSVAAAARAGIMGFNEHPFMIDAAGEPMRIASAPWLEAGLSGMARCEALLFPALDQIVEVLAGMPQLQVAVALALPEERPGLPVALQHELLAAVSTRYPQMFSASAMFPHGHAAGFLALAAAHRKLVEGALDACIVAGVDTYLDPLTLEWLEECDQLHGAGVFNNEFGFIPGEGAGAVLLMREDVIERVGAVVLAQLLGVGTAMEPHRIKTESVCIGEGLTAAFRSALQPLQSGEQVTDVYCDMNGEVYRADEYGFTALRTKEYFQSASDFVAPADCWGDVSAAGVPLHIILATIAGAKSYANGSTAFVWASSEQGHRGAALLRTQQGQAHAG